MSYKQLWDQNFSNSKYPSTARAISSERNSDLINNLACFLKNFLIFFKVDDYSPNLVLRISFKIPSIRILKIINHKWLSLRI